MVCEMKNTGAPQHFHMNADDTRPNSPEMPLMEEFLAVDSPTVETINTESSKNVSSDSDNSPQKIPPSIYKPSHNLFDYSFQAPTGSSSSTMAVHP